jgi:lipoprotein-anchoring transpeptidase ErfK/SrfK
VVLSDPDSPRPHARAYLIGGVAAVLVISAAAVGLARGIDAGPEAGADWVSPPPSAAAPAASAAPLTAAPPPEDLPVITYAKGPKGLPDDTESETGPVPAAALRPVEKMALYDAPGGKPRAFLPPRISGLPVVAPIVAERDGWVAVLAPSANRKVGWVPAEGWRPEPLIDHIVVDLSERSLTWFRDGEEQQDWTVAIGTNKTPTPPGRQFVMGQTKTSGAVFGGVNALVLSSVPEDLEHLPASLRGAHTAIHGWTNSSAFGRNVSNGCLRMPTSAQRALLKEISAGTPVMVVP